MTGFIIQLAIELPQIRQWGASQSKPEIKVNAKDKKLII
jgi:hypothetical protein